jgi:hypothetical protein
VQPISSLHFVAVFDILGFKSLREKLGTAGLFQKFDRSILPRVQHSAAGRHRTDVRDGKQVLVPDFNEFSANYRVFSDTVLFWTRDDSFGSFMTIVETASQLSAAGFGTGCPYRGAIAHGDLLDSGEIILGRGIEDAYQWEQRQAWPGVSLTPDCERFCSAHNYLRLRRDAFTTAAEVESDEIKKRKLLNEVRRLINYPVALQDNPKDGPATYTARTCVVLDWTLNVFAGAAESSMGESTSCHARAIKANTVQFEHWARKLSLEG